MSKFRPVAPGPLQIYRLISCGTVEEKIYRKQVFKRGLFRSGVEEGIPYRYFSHQVHQPCLVLMHCHKAVRHICRG